ncbi:hypothetical protein Tco_0786830 [Tanacetum coccineum]
MSNRHQELASPEQTASGKDFSNPLMADSLPKTIWFSTHHASHNEHWLFQCKRLTVKKYLSVYGRSQKSSSSSSEELTNSHVFWIIPSGVQDAQTEETCKLTSEHHV